MKRKIMIVLLAGMMLAACGKKVEQPIPDSSTASVVIPDSPMSVESVPTVTDIKKQETDIETLNKEDIYPLAYREMKSIGGNKTGKVLCFEKTEGESNGEGALSQTRGTVRYDVFLHETTMSEEEMKAYLLEMEDMTASYYEEEDGYSDIFQSPIYQTGSKGGAMVYVSVKTDKGYSEYQSFIVESRSDSEEVVMANMFWESGNKDNKEETKALRTVEAIHHAYGFDDAEWDNQPNKKEEAKKDKSKVEAKKDESKPESQKDDSKSEAKKDDSKVEVKKEESKPESQKDEIKAETKKDDSKAETKDESRAEKDKTESQRTEVRSADTPNSSSVQNGSASFSASKSKTASK